MGTIVKGIYKGILVLLAMSSTAFASDTSSEINQKHSKKEQVILLVSVMDEAAFYQEDAESLERYTKKILPHHKFIHISTYSSKEFRNPLTHQLNSVREEIIGQMKTKILPHHEITHFIIMDHGNTHFEKYPSTGFRYLGFFDEKELSRGFKSVFSHLVGKFSDNPMIMLESCSTSCDGVGSSEKRMKLFLDYFQIKNATLFSAYVEMISMGYDLKYHLQHVTGKMSSAGFISSALLLGVLTQAPAFLDHEPLNLTLFAASLLGVDVGLPLITKIYGYIRDRMMGYNWGYLYNFKKGNLTKAYQLDPHKNLNEMYLKLTPKTFKKEMNTCTALFN